MKLIPNKYITKESEDVANYLDLVSNTPDDFIKKMALICKRKNGVALSAVQVGIFKKLFYSTIDFLTDEKRDVIYINPTYEPLSKKITDSKEGCLSYNEGKDKYLVNRYNRIRATFNYIDPYSETGLTKYTEELSGTNAIIFQHETDHSYGITIATKGEKIE